MIWIRYGAMHASRVREGPWPRSVIKTWCMMRNCIILQNDSRLEKISCFSEEDILVVVRHLLEMIAMTWIFFHLHWLKFEILARYEFPETRLIVSSLFHLHIKLTSSASDLEQRQSFQRRKVRNVEQWSLSVSTILELEGRERGQMLTSSSKYSKKCKFR